MAEMPEIDMLFYTVFDADQIKSQVGFGYR